MLSVWSEAKRIVCRWFRLCGIPDGDHRAIIKTGNHYLRWLPLLSSVANRFWSYCYLEGWKRNGWNLPSFMLISSRSISRARKASDLSNGSNYISCCVYSGFTEGAKSETLWEWVLCQPELWWQPYDTACDWLVKLYLRHLINTFIVNYG